MINPSDWHPKFKLGHKEPPKNQNNSHYAKSVQPEHSSKGDPKSRNHTTTRSALEQTQHPGNYVTTFPLTLRLILYPGRWYGVPFWLGLPPYLIATKTLDKTQVLVRACTTLRQNTTTHTSTHDWLFLYKQGVCLLGCIPCHLPHLATMPANLRTLTRVLHRHSLSASYVQHGSLWRFKKKFSRVINNRIWKDYEMNIYLHKRKKYKRKR